MTSNDASESQKRISFPIILLIVTSALFYAYEYALRVAPNKMIHYIMHQFAITSGTAGLLISLYYWVYAPLQLVVGILTDYFQPRKTLACAIIFCAIGSLLFPTPSSFTLTAMGRIIIGAGSAFAYVGALAMANKWLNKRIFTLFAGILTALGMLTGIVNDIELPILIQKYSWTQIFFAAALFGVALLLLLKLGYCLKDRRHLISHQHEAHDNWKQTITNYIQIVKRADMWFVSIIGSLLFLSLSLFGEFWGPSILSAKYHISIQASSEINSFIYSGWLIGALLQSLIFKFQPCYKKNFIVQSTLSFLAILTVIFFKTSILQSECLLFIYGFFASVEILCFTYAVEANADRGTASVVAFVNLIVMLSGALFQPFASALLDQTWSGKMIGDTRYYAYTDYQHALYFLPICALITICLCLYLPNRKSGDNFNTNKADNNK